MLRLLPRAWQFPHLARLRIGFQNRTYTSPGFRPTPWRRAVSFMVSGSGCGTIEVCYLRHPPVSGPIFLPEEDRLLVSLARLLKAFFLKLWAEEGRLKAKSQLQLAVARRTAQLQRLNRSLQREVAEKRRSEKEIARYQARLKLLALQLAMFEEEERRNIAADLHDHIGQNLMMIRMNLSSLRMAVADRPARNLLREIDQRLQQTISYTRNLTFEVLPPVLYELGLKAALEWLAEHFQEKHRLRIRVRGDQPFKGLDRKLQFVLFMAARELLFNVVKHAGAGRVDIRLSRRGRTLRLAVSDNGRGFDPGAAGRRATATKGYGLFGIRERLLYFSGRLIVDSAPGRGSRIIMEIPLEGGAEHGAEDTAGR